MSNPDHYPIYYGKRTGWITYSENNGISSFAGLGDITTFRALLQDDPTIKVIIWRNIPNTQE